MKHSKQGSVRTANGFNISREQRNWNIPHSSVQNKERTKRHRNKNVTTTTTTIPFWWNILKERRCTAGVAAVLYNALRFCEPLLKISGTCKINSHQNIFSKCFNLFPLLHKSKYVTIKPCWREVLCWNGFLKITCKCIPKFLHHAQIYVRSSKI